MISDLIERAIWTGVEVGLSVATVEALTGVDAKYTLQVALVAALYSALKTVAKGRLDILAP